MCKPIFVSTNCEYLQETEAKIEENELAFKGKGLKE
jgi:hypothetical protein